MVILSRVFCCTKNMFVDFRFNTVLKCFYCGICTKMWNKCINSFLVLEFIFFIEFIGCRLRDFASVIELSQCLNMIPLKWEVVHQSGQLCTCLDTKTANYPVPATACHSSHGQHAGGKDDCCSPLGALLCLRRGSAPRSDNDRSRRRRGDGLRKDVRRSLDDERVSGL